MTASHSKYLIGVWADTGHPKNQDKNGKYSMPVVRLPWWHLLLPLVSQGILWNWENNLGNLLVGLQTVLISVITRDLNVWSYQGPIITSGALYKEVRWHEASLSFVRWSPLVLYRCHSHPVHSPTLAHICVTSRMCQRHLDGSFVVSTLFSLFSCCAGSHWYQLWWCLGISRGGEPRPSAKS